MGGGMLRRKYPCRIDGTIEAREVEIGVGCVVEAGAYIGGKNETARRVRLGDFCHIGPGVRITAPQFEIGDYSKLHANSLGHGKLPLRIGRNCWIGSGVILDSMGGLIVDDNVGIGSHSQIWTHIQFGDIVEGCRFYSSKPMFIPKDVWFVGHCLVSPVTIGEKSMALAGSVITREMLPNHVYGGVPAEDLSEKLGVQFQNRSIKQKYCKMRLLVEEFISRNPAHKGKLEVITSMDQRREGITCFDVSSRTYTKTYSRAEVDFMRAYVPLVKFTPADEP